MQPSYATQGRSIPGAVATQGQNVRVEFLRKTYIHLGLAVFAWIGVCYALLNSSFGYAYLDWAYGGGGRGNMLIVLVAFLGAGWLANKFAFSQTSRGIQYLGLGIYVVAMSFIILPLLFVAQAVAVQNGMDANALIGQAAVVTLVLFGGLTATVLVTKKDFTFMGKTLNLLMWVALATIVGGLVFGFSLGLWFSVIMLALCGGYVLYYTSAVMQHFPPTHYVGAALALFSAISMMFFYVLRIVISLNRN